MNVRYVKILLCFSVNSHFAVLHQWIDQSCIKAMKLKNITNYSFDDLKFFLRNIHNINDYQYTVLSSWLNCVIELLNISPVLWYVCLKLYSVKMIQKEWLTDFFQTSVIVWLVYMFCLNWESFTAWLCFELSQSEQNWIITDFNNSNDSLEILLSTHAIEDFEIDLQTNCHNMIILEHFRNLNTLL